jgi:hypothetical protein
MGCNIFAQGYKPIHLSTLAFNMESFRYYIYIRDTILMGPEDISENFGESRHCKNLRFEYFGKTRPASVKI